MKKIIAAAVTVTTVLSLAACGGNTAVDKSDCLDVPQDVLNVVASGSDSSGLKPETGKAVKGDTEGTYWLAMKFTADGFNGDTETGIWLVLMPPAPRRSCRLTVSPSNSRTGPRKSTVPS